MFAGALRKKHRIDGYIRNNCLEPKSIVPRFEAIREEKLRRGHSPNYDTSFFDDVDIGYLPEYQQTFEVDVEASLQDLLNRCPRCRERHSKHFGQRKP